MEEFNHITPPSGEDDIEGARRVFDEFLTLYQPVLIRVEHQLEKVIGDLDPAFAEAYRPWQVALHDLLRGAYLVAKKIPLPDLDGFMEALSMFSFESAIQFLRDICDSCRMVIEYDWVRRFREHVDMMLFSLAILNRSREAELAR